VDNIKMDVVEIGLCELDWIGQVQDKGQWRAVMSAVMNVPVP
jgi:hypothetical protein